MNKVAFRGGLTFASGVACAAVAYAFRDVPIASGGFSLIIAAVMGLISAAKEE